MAVLWWSAGIIFAILILIGLYLEWRKPPVCCPNCASTAYSITSKEPLGMKNYSFRTGGDPGGGFTDVRVKYRVRYQCNDCEHIHVEEIEE